MESRRDRDVRREDIRPVLPDRFDQSSQIRVRCKGSGTHVDESDEIVEGLECKRRELILDLNRKEGSQLDPKDEGAGLARGRTRDQAPGEMIWAGVG